MRSDPNWHMTDSQLRDMYTTLTPIMLCTLLTIDAATTLVKGQATFYGSRSPLALVVRGLASEVFGIGVDRTTRCSFAYRITPRGQRLVKMFRGKNNA